MRRLRPCAPPRLRPPCLLRPLRRARRRALMVLHGWVEEVDGDVVRFSGHEVWPRDGGRISGTTGLGRFRPTERAHLRPGTYVVLEVREGPPVAPWRRFPFRMARVGAWTAEDVAEARRDGAALADAVEGLGWDDGA